MTVSPVAFHVFVSGRVQGVGYRYHTVRAAERLGIAGWVRNLPDGRVEAFIQGAPDAVDAMLAWMRQGPPAAAVLSVEASPADPDPTLRTFAIVG